MANKEKFYAKNAKKEKGFNKKNHELTPYQKECQQAPHRRKHREVVC